MGAHRRDAPARLGLAEADDIRLSIGATPRVDLPKSRRQTLLGT